MHTTGISRDWTAHHNGDFSGDVIIDGPTIDIDPTIHKNGKSTIAVPMFVLERIVAQAVRNRQIEKWEEADVEKILYDR